MKNKWVRRGVYWGLVLFLSYGLFLLTRMLYGQTVELWVQSRATVTVLYLPFLLLVNPVLACGVVERLLPHTEGDKSLLNTLGVGICLSAALGVICLMWGR